MATTITSTELDFNAIKNNLKRSLGNSTEFADYNFEGSGLSNLLDVLATNTHMNALVANMALNESYLTTAQLRSSVVSLAEGIGYIPSSKVAAQATVNLSINTGALAGRPQVVTLPRGTKFNSTVNDVNYTFETIATVTAEDDGFGLYQFKTVDGDTNIVIKEGVSTTKTFFVTENSIDSVYVIPDPDIDITTAVVEVFDDATSTFFETYINLRDADTIDDTTKLYILREAPNGFFELSFGDGNTLGKRPTAGQKIVVTYLSTNGPDANTASNFTPVSQVTVLSSNFTLSTTTNTNAQAGSVLETVDSIRKNAPFSYASQNRMVTAADYSSLILRNFGHLIKDIQAYGGEDALQPEFGTVFISVEFKSTLTQAVVDAAKADILALARQLSVISFNLKFVDPDKTFIESKVVFQFNPKFTSSSLQEIQDRVEAAVRNYFENNTGLFSQSFRRSNLLTDVDAVSTAVLSSRATLLMQKRHIPTLNTNESVKLRFVAGISEPEEKTHVITSSSFFHKGTACIIRNKLESTKLQLISTDDNSILVDNIGSYDPATGIVSLEGLLVDSIIGGAAYIQVRAVPANQSAIDPQRSDLIVYDDGPSFVQGLITTAS